MASNGKAYFFKKNGAWNVKKTKSLRKLTKYGKKNKNLLKNVKKLLGKPKKTRIGNSCNHFDNDSRAIYKDYTLRYQNVEIQLTKNTRTGVYYMNGIFGRDK